jgi:hypothetical protein
LTIVEKLDSEQKLSPQQKNWPDLTRTALAKLPPDVTTAPQTNK